MTVSTISKFLKYPFFILSLFVLTACGGAKVSRDLPFELRFLDEYLIPDDLMVDGTLVGGMSDLDYDGEYYYTIVDLPSSPRIYKMAIDINGRKIDTIRFVETINIKHKTEETKTRTFDLEGLIYDGEQNQYIISSEGNINRGKDPFIASVDSEGNVLEYYEIPKYFQASYPNGPRNNGVLEGLDRSADGDGFWAVMELPLEMDGPTVKIYGTTSPVRFTYYDWETKTPQKQFVYTLDRLRKMPLLPFAVNGISGIMEYDEDQFIVIERAYSAGHGSYGNRIMLYLADGRNATNTIDETNLKSKINKSVVPAKKQLIFDFNSVKRQLSEGFADNIEGIIFGPKLSNGNQSLLLISDNNFNSFSKQINQVILMEVIQK